MRTARLSLFAAAAALAAGADTTSPGLPDASLNANRSADARSVGGVFTQTNDATGNAVVAYTRRADGSLSYLGAYTANAGSGSISGYAVAANGALTLLPPDGRTGVTGDRTTPLDMDVSRNSRFLYVLEGATGNITGFEIGHDGSLSPMADVAPPAGARGRGGIAAY